VTPTDPNPIVMPPGSASTLSTEGARGLPPNAGDLLLALARSAIAIELGFDHPAQAEHTWLGRPGACFVTLTAAGTLRGCVGTLRAHRALGDDVRANAIAAAFRDPRFPPIATGEWRAVALELSVLSALEPLACTTEAEAIARLRAGVDGVVLEYGHHCGTFLPQVWEGLTEPGDFLAHLKYKAGLPPDFWDRDLKLSRYTVTKWREHS
jgi:AmmeMemoRadiSam system protein A